MNKIQRPPEHHSMNPFIIHSHHYFECKYDTHTKKNHAIMESATATTPQILTTKFVPVSLTSLEFLPFSDELLLELNAGQSAYTAESKYQPSIFKSTTKT